MSIYITYIYVYMYAYTYMFISINETNWELLRNRCPKASFSSQSLARTPKKYLSTLAPETIPCNQSFEIGII